MVVALLHLIAAAPVGEHILDVGEIGVEVVGVGDRLERADQQVGLRITGQVAQGAVDLEEAAVGGDKGHPDRGVVERAAEAVLGLGERLVAPSVLTDVDDMSDEHSRARFRVGGHRPAQLDPRRRSIGSHIALLARVFAAGAARQFAQRLLVGGDVVGVRDRPEVATQELVLVPFDDRAERRVDGEHGSAWITDDHPGRGGSKQLSERLGARRAIGVDGHRRRDVALTRRIVSGEHPDYLANAHTGVLRTAQRGAEMDLVVISGPDAGARQISLVDQLADDAVRGSLADADLARDLPKPEVGLLCQRGEHVQVVGEERPSRHASVIGARARGHELRVMSLQRSATGPDNNMTFDS